MHIVVIIILGVILFYSIKTTKSILHPASITSCLWLVLVSVYSFIDHGLYSLSDKFYIALLLWTVPLCLISLFAYKYKYSLPKAISRPYPNNSIRIIYPIMIVCVVFATYGLYLKGLHYNSSNFFAGIRALSVATLNGEEDTFQAPLYIKISTILAQYSLIVLLSIWHKKKNYMPYIFFVVVVFAFFFIVVNILKENVNRHK